MPDEKDELAEELKALGPAINFLGNQVSLLMGSINNLNKNLKKLIEQL